jgi:hypothetical protein
MAGKKSSGVFVSWPKPTFALTVKTNKNFRTNFHAAMMYAHYEMTSNELKKETMVYLKKLDAKHPLLDRIKDMDENRFSTIGKYMYILNHGGDVPDDMMCSLMPHLEKTICEEEAKTTKAEKESEYIASKENGTKDVDTTPKVVISIQDRLRDKAHEVAGEVEGWLDDFTMDKKQPAKTVEDFTNLFKTYELKAPHMRHMHMIFERRAEEIANAVEGKDKELAEAYSNFTKPELKKLDLFYKNLLRAADMMQEVAKVERAPRKKKPVSQEKLVSKIRYKKDDNQLGIVSLHPVQIIGAREVWVYNTKTRKLGQYKAADERGLTVKGASLLNYSSDSAEKTVRKPVETLADFKKASKVKLRTFMKELTTVDIPCAGKLNEHHVILRVDK